MKAVILAAGMGSRLQKVSGGLPKSMIKIGKSSIIHHQLESCLKVNIIEFVIVLGYKMEQLKTHILEKISSEQVTFIENPIYDTTNTLYSLWLTHELLNDDFIYFNADVLFQSDLLKKISNDSQYSQLLLETKSCAEEEVKMIIDDDMRIQQISKQLPIAKCAGEFIGIGKFNKNILEKFVHYLQFGVDNGQSNNYFEYAVDLLAKDKVLKAVPTNGISCIEIDFPEDLVKAKEMFSL
ncbi:MAG: phosphocholine cytidylyltransferase family protein [Candidatus Tenebribacter davisii]|nr:phosphocholine cytidylyltransferase family protein [Candidatus Tenebribacter davisii]